MSGQERAPRGLYFKAEDRPELKAKPKNPKVPDQYGIECSQRMRKLAKVLEDARNVVKAVDALPSMDDAGLTIHGIEYISTRIEFLADSFQILSDDVEAAGGRWERANPPALADDQAAIRPGFGIQITSHANPEDVAAVINARRMSPKLWGKAL
ncbi:hypothetical protein [Pseudarthrobacter polychromogenes]|uniref:Uncharacterized protein n=1 Tax=Pseudarthrobacter polychromogenes TaxID=1676 RepID=A0ABQ1Y2L6_9MICC|nr:hypothetical protein [Pseudarthrobacter polychromogenes]GGH10141.1 hypothetical protein GCM10011577_38860 [Pseudarthrobacter polychromogenes]